MYSLFTIREKFIAVLIMQFSEGFYIGDHLKVNRCGSFSHVNGTFFTSNLKTTGAPLNTTTQCMYNFMYSACHCYDYLCTVHVTVTTTYA